jgi:hypothetical protein
MSRTLRRRILYILLGLLIVLLVLAGIGYGCLQWEGKNPIRIHLVSQELVHRKYTGIHYQIDVENPSASPVWIFGADAGAHFPASGYHSSHGHPESLRPAGSDITSATIVAQKTPILIPPRSTLRFFQRELINQGHPVPENTFRYLWSSSRRYRAHQRLAKWSKHLPAWVEIHLPTFIPEEAVSPLEHPPAPSP